MLRCTIRKSSRRAVVSVASRTALYVDRRRRLPTADTTRNTTCTGCLARSSSRFLCGEPARGPLGLRPGFLPRRRLRPDPPLPPRTLLFGVANNGSCSGSVGRARPSRERVPFATFEIYLVIIVHATRCRVAPAVADRGPHQIRTRRFPPSGSSVRSTYGVFQICTLILANGSG